MPAYRWGCFLPTGSAGVGLFEAGELLNLGNPRDPPHQKVGLQPFGAVTSMFLPAHWLKKLVKSAVDNGKLSDLPSADHIA